MQHHQTVKEVLTLIRKAKEVYVRPYFGVMERWVKISKVEANRMFNTYQSFAFIYEILDFDHELKLEEDGNLYLG